MPNPALYNSVCLPSGHPNIDIACAFLEICAMRLSPVLARSQAMSCLSPCFFVNIWQWINTIGCKTQYHYNNLTQAQLVMSDARRCARSYVFCFTYIWWVIRFLVSNSWEYWNKSSYSSKREKDNPPDFPGLHIPYWFRQSVWFLFLPYWFFLCDFCFTFVLGVQLCGRLRGFLNPAGKAAPLLATPPPGDIGYGLSWWMSFLYFCRY